MVKIRHCMEFEVLVAGEASGCGNLQRKGLAVESCPSEEIVVKFDKSHGLSSRDREESGNCVDPG